MSDESAKLGEVFAVVPPHLVSSAPVLEIRGAAVHFGGIKAVDGVSLQVSGGRISGIIGPNGSGKSTLLAAITRLVSLTSGELLFDGTSFHEIAPFRVAQMGISRSFQTVRLLSDLTVAENIELGADLRRTSRRARSKLVSETIARAGLIGMGHLRVSSLSYGAQRRVEIARALAMSPRLLLLDEPTAGMNHSERAEIQNLLQKLRDEGLTQLLVEHDVQMMVDTCDYLFGMNFGRLIAEGPPVDVVRNPAIQEAFLGKRYSANASD